MFFNLKEGTRGNYLFRRCRNTGEAVGVPSLDALKARLDGVVDSLIWWVATCPRKRGGDWMVFKGSFQPKPFYEMLQ